VGGFSARAAFVKLLIIGEFIVTVLCGTSFLTLFLLDSVGVHSENPGVRAAARHLVAATSVAIIEAMGLTLLAFGVPVPVWVFAVGYGVGAAVMVHRNVLIIRARRKRASAAAR